MMEKTEPRPGWRTTAYMETVDPDGLKVSDTLQNWYGKADAESNYAHNQMAWDIADAVNKATQLWGTEKAVVHGVDPEKIETHHAIRSEIVSRAKETPSG